jgi:hypothetical protein
MKRLPATWRQIKLASLHIAAALLVVALAGDAWACPTCRENLADPQARGLATGLYYSILLMMSMPFALVGTLGFVAYRSVKRAAAEREAAASEPTA